MTLFDGGRRHAVSDQAKAAYDQSVASYREIVLTSFQDVEDNLAALRILENESKTQTDAVTAAERTLTLSTSLYKGGLTTYLQVITSAERNPRERTHSRRYIDQAYGHQASC